MQESVTYQLIKDEGAEENSRKIAVNLLKEGLSIELVAKITGLTVEELQQLQNAPTLNQEE